MRNLRTPIIGLMAAAMLTVGLTSTTAEAHRRTHVTDGSFETLSGGVELGYQIQGRATMFRTHAFGGRTIVTVHVKGLDPRTTYPAHVHDQPCSATPAGGVHYQHVVGGPVDSVNEIWPVVNSGPRGRGFGFAIHGHVAREDARSVVIHYPPDTSIRLACADLN